MELSIEFEKKEGLTVISVNGTYTPESAKSTLVQALDYLKKQKINRALVDCRHIVNLTEKMMDHYDYAYFLTEECAKREIHPRMAYLYNSPIVMFSQKFGQTVAENRGFTGRVFSDYQQACSWLQQ